MTRKTISGGVVHDAPADLKKTVVADPALHTIWEDLTPIARNEFICWIDSAKKQETRERRMRIMCENLIAGKRRPCCWPGCPHR